MERQSKYRTLWTVAAVLFLLPQTVYAYGGPGSIVSGIGALLAAVAAVAAAIFGFFWFPLKRLYQKVRGEDEEADTAAEDAAH